MKTVLEKSPAGKVITDAIVFFAFEDLNLLQQKFNDIEKILKVKLPQFIHDDFKGKDTQVMMVYTKNRRIILSGLGKKKKFGLEKLRKAAARAAKKVKNMKFKKISLEIFDNDGTDLTDAAKAETIAVILGFYSFSKYYTSKNKKEKITIKEVSFFNTGKSIEMDFKAIEKAIKNAAVIAAAANFARDLGNEPSNILYPDALANLISERSKTSGYEVEILKTDKLKNMGMNAVLEVAKGSSREPRFLILRYNGGMNNEKPVILVGKGVTFDSGGISIKPSAGMASMKMDMGGAAAVIGTFEAIARLKLKKNVIGLVPLVENMPDGSSYKPGDVITAYNGLTIEIDNTDAEGRLILADALAYAAGFNPEYVIDLATLTGAAVVALGHYATIAMGNDEGLINKIKISGEKSGERVWELPLWDEYDSLIDSDIADVRNTGKDRSAGTIIGGMFLKRFVKSFSWVHLDIAGTGMMNTDSDYIPKYATGVGVRLLTELLAD
jgi:leucyl aminopeptidase